MEALEGNFDLLLVSYDLCIRCYNTLKFKTKGGKFTEHNPRVILSDHMQPHERHNKWNPIHVRTGEEIEMPEFKQFQIKQSLKFKDPQL